MTGTGTDVSTVAGPPQIESVSPSPLPEGGSATIEGSGFDGIAAGDTVAVDGVRAEIASASPTSLRITVPRLACLPARMVTVRVATRGGAAETRTGLEPARAPIALAVGRQSLITDPGAFCVRFAASQADERYVVGVQSLSGVASDLTRVTITSRTVGGAPPAGVASLDVGSLSAGAVSLPARGGSFGEATGAGSPAWEAADDRAESLLRRWERDRLDPAASIPALRDGRGALRVAASISGGGTVGDTLHLRVPNYASQDPCHTYTDVTATVQAIGERAIVVADTANPSDGFTQADYQSLSDQLDTKIFSVDEAYFGHPGDIDGNAHILVLFSRAVNAVTLSNPRLSLLGFVFAGDWYARFGSGFTCPASDQGEIYYGRVPDPAGTYGQPSSRSQEMARAPTVMAHELVHLIQFGRRFGEGLGFIGSSMAEAQASLGEEVVGHAVTGHTTYRNYGAATIDGDADWYLNKFSDLSDYFGFEGSTRRVAAAPEQCGWWQQAASPCSGRSLWYGVGWSFLRWLSDTYGPGYPGGEEGLQRALVTAAGTGPKIAADVVGVPLETLMARWSAALYVDDRIPNADPSLTFTSWNLRDYEQSMPSTARLEPVEETFGDWSIAGDVRASSTGYVAVEGRDRPAVAIEVAGADGGDLPASMQVWVVRVR